MKTLLRLLVPTLVLVVLAPSSRAAAPSDDRPLGWLGILMDQRDASQGEDATFPSDTQGVLVRGVIEGSPAQEARLRAKDAIVAVDGTVVAGAPELMARFRELAPGSFVTLSVKRGERDLELTAVVGTRPEETGRMKLIAGWLGVEGIELPGSLREHFGAPDDAGILVSKVVDGSPADDSGIRIGDVIYEADGKPVTSLGNLSRIVTEAGVENTIDVVLLRDGARIVVGPQIARSPSAAPR